MTRSLCPEPKHFVVLVTLANFNTDGEPTVIVGGKKYTRERLQKKIKVYENHIAKMKAKLDEFRTSLAKLSADEKKVKIVKKLTK